ncbi:metallophosphoesterase family protein [Allohahella marinimesophila]|uniref:Phosphoesterase n=1 Tax=Allohahella marinimesophila TaxID=1054972 RepID=A0ABP7PFW7_9GAMM
MNIGVIADTHGLLRPRAAEALAGSDLIIHAGDIGQDAVLDRLEHIAPVIAIRGNIDTSGRAADLPDTRVLDFAGHQLFLLHDVKTLDPCAAAGCRIIIAGHSHKPRNDVLDGVLYFNPGSAGRRRFRLPITVGRLTLLPGTAKGTIIPLDLT